MLYEIKFSYHTIHLFKVYSSLGFSCIRVIEPKFVCLMHSEAKQTETSEFGAEKGLLQGHAKKTGALCSKYPNSPMVSGEEFLRQILG